MNGAGTTRSTVRASLQSVRAGYPSFLANHPWLLGPLWTLLGSATFAAPVGAAATASSESPASPTLTGEDSSLFALPTTRDHIGRIVVPVTVNGKGPFRFIVDTGATSSTVTPDLVRSLGLKASEVSVVLLDGITGSTQVSAVTLDKFQTGNLTEGGLLAPVVWGSVMAGADGIFGAAGLTEKSLSVDFERNRVEISDGVRFVARSEAFKIHATRAMHGLMVLAIRVGRVHALAVIDTGSERTLGNLALRDALNERRRPGTVAKITSVFGATAQVEPGEIWRAPTIVIDTLRITDVEVVYGDFHVFKVWEMEDKPAMLIGMDVLGTVGSLGIDFKNQVIYLTNSTSVGQSFRSPAGVLASPNQVH